jgi:ABC-type sugar transport system substrate-binding protein
MKEPTKRFFVFALALVLLFSAASCAKREGTGAEAGARVSVRPESDYPLFPFLKDYVQYRYDGEFNVLYLVCTTLAEYFVNSYEVWEPRLREAGINMDLLGPPAYSDESLLATLESSLQTRKYDIIVLYPITPQAITPFLETAWETYKTPILGYAFAPDTGCGHYYFGTSYYEAGLTLGRTIVEYVNDNAAYYDTLKTIPVAVFKSAGAAEQYARIRGAMDILREDGRFTILQEYEANGDVQCLAATETVLMTYPDVEVILTQIDSDVPGVYQALTSGNYKCSEYLSVWGFDATGVVCNIMLGDGIDGFVQGSAFIQHELACDGLIEILPILVGAAKQNVLIPFTPDQAGEMGTGLRRFYVTVTPKNVQQYFTPR